MQEIRCPKCGEVFQVDEKGYDQIARQVRDKEFSKELERLEKESEDKRKREIELIRLQEEKEFNEGIIKKDAEIQEKEQMIAQLKSRLDATETEKKLAVSQALEENNQERSKQEREYSENIAKKDAEISERDRKIAQLQAKLEAGETATKLAVAEAVEKKDRKSVV